MCLKFSENNNKSIELNLKTTSQKIRIAHRITCSFLTRYLTRLCRVHIFVLFCIYWVHLREETEQMTSTVYTNIHLLTKFLQS